MSNMERCDDVRTGLHVSHSTDIPCGDITIECSGGASAKHYANVCSTVRLRVIQKVNK